MSKEFKEMDPERFSIDDVLDIMEEKYHGSKKSSKKKDKKKKTKKDKE